MYEPDRACVIQVERVVKMPTFYAEDTAASANEVWSRLHSDPLFAVRALGPSCLPIKLASPKGRTPSVSGSLRIAGPACVTPCNSAAVHEISRQSSS